jgi:hypothetical protein
MPEIARFYGIIIRMYFLPGEHNPPHIHAIYQNYIIAISLVDLSTLSGTLPPKAKSMVIEWIKIHQSELLEMWNTQTLKQLKPLE